MVYVEFQAVVLAGGRGSRMQEIASGRPKCLLPVGPYPMIFYPLQMLIKHGFVGTYMDGYSLLITNCW